MTELLEYLASEVAENFARASCSRREAMRRLGLLGTTGGIAVGATTSASDVSLVNDPELPAEPQPALWYCDERPNEYREGVS